MGKIRGGFVLCFITALYSTQRQAGASESGSYERKLPGTDNSLALAERKHKLNVTKLNRKKSKQRSNL